MEVSRTLLVYYLLIEVHTGLSPCGEAVPCILSHYDEYEFLALLCLGGDLVLWNSIHAAIFQLWNIALKSDYSERQERFTPVNATTGRFTPVVNPVGHAKDEPFPHGSQAN